MKRFSILSLFVLLAVPAHAQEKPVDRQSAEKQEPSAEEARVRALEVQVIPFSAN